MTAMKILFPTDFSGAADNAYIYALKLADRLQASITVVHIYALLQVHSWVENAVDMDEVNEKITLGEFADFRKQMEVLKKIAKESGLDHIDVNYSLKESDYVVGAILQEAQDTQTDVIVMGTTGATGLKEIFFGSVASLVMQSATCPVLMVPDGSVYKGIQKIGLTLDYKPGELALIEKALRITRMLGGHLHCLHVDTYDPDKEVLKAQEYREAFQHEADISFHVHHDLDIEKGILEFMKFNQMDVVIMHVQQQSILKQLFSYSIAKRIAYHSDIPLIGFQVPS